MDNKEQNYGIDERLEDIRIKLNLPYISDIRFEENRVKVLHYLLCHDIKEKEYNHYLKIMKYIGERSNEK